MNSLTNKFNNDFTIDTIAKITNSDLTDLPHYDTINDVFDDLDIDELRKNSKNILLMLLFALKCLISLDIMVSFNF